MLRSSSRTMGRFAQRRAHRGFGWEKVVKPWTSQATIDRFKVSESELLAKEKYTNSIPASVDAIDWDYWNSAISAPGVVDALKKEYESHEFSDVDVNTDVSGAKELEKEIFDLQVKSKVANVELKACDEVIDKTIKMKTDMLDWHETDWYVKIPGLKQELLDEWDEEMYTVSLEEERRGQVDYAQLAKDVSEGKLDTNPVAPPEKIGDLTSAEIEDAKAKGYWTIATFMQPKEERQRLYAERKKLVDGVKAELLKSS